MTICSTHLAVVVDVLVIVVAMLLVCLTIRHLLGLEITVRVEIRVKEREKSYLESKRQSGSPPTAASLGPRHCK